MHVEPHPLSGKKLAPALTEPGISEISRMEKAMDTANNISLPEPLLAEIQNAAQAEHRGVDEVLTDAVKRYVEERSWTNLLNYGAERGKTLGIKESDVDRLIAESRAEQRNY
jgi:metal-responsive CopG/Arc/MetJ family transcriptional regulator